MLKDGLWRKGHGSQQCMGYSLYMQFHWDTIMTGHTTEARRGMQLPLLDSNKIINATGVDYKKTVNHNHDKTYHSKTLVHATVRDHGITKSIKEEWHEKRWR